MVKRNAPQFIVTEAGAVKFHGTKTSCLSYIAYRFRLFPEVRDLTIARLPA